MLWETRSGAALGCFGKEKGQVGFVAISQDGRGLLSQYLDSSGQDRENPLFLWEAISGKARLCLKGQRGNLDAGAFSPDGRLLAVAGPTGAWLWDLSTGKRTTEIAGHRGQVTALAFSPDGKRLFSGSEDTTVLVWDVARLVSTRPPQPKLTAKQMEALWDDLAGDDAVKAYRAIWVLAAQAGRVEPFLKDKLENGSASPARIRWLIAELDSEEFTSRQYASQELEKLGRLAGPRLREALARGPSLEVAWRVKELLGKFGKRGSPAEVRSSRALEVLHRVDSAQARRLLKAFTTEAAKDGQK
jgi:hypothetical protein